MGETTTIDITPSWTGILPVLIESRVNIERKRAADECDATLENMWCSIHDAEVVKSYGHPICAVQDDRAAKAAWQKDLWESREASDASFAKMARGADRYNLIAKAYRQFTEDNDDTALHERLYAILTGAA